MRKSPGVLEKGKKQCIGIILLITPHKRFCQVQNSKICENQVLPLDGKNQLERVIDK
jgi:hypothetical protein